MITRIFYTYFKNNIRSILLLTIIISSAQHLSAQNMEKIGAFHSLAMQCKDAIEGYTKSNNESEYNFYSLQIGIDDAMIGRASGKKTIDWNTGAVPSDYDRQKGARFLFLVDMNTWGNNKFNFFVDGVNKFSFGNERSQSWSDTSRDGGILSFTAFDIDNSGVAMGYITLDAPSSWLTSGKALRLKIVGATPNGTGWIMLFKSPNALAYLLGKAAYEKLFYLTSSRQRDALTFQLKAPAFYDNQELAFKVGEKIQKVRGKLQDSVVIYHAKFDLKPRSFTPASTLEIFNGNEHLFIVDSFFAPTKTSYAATSEGLVIKEGKMTASGGGEKSIRMRYGVDMAHDLKLLAKKGAADYPLYQMNSSHQDIAWMDSPEKCEMRRDTFVISPLLSIMERDSTYHFDIEYVLMIREYIRRHPDKKKVIQHFLDNGQLNVGGSYNSTYEDMYSGESLVRQFYEGSRWMKKNFDFSPTTYWNVDVPGRTLQMPQILKKSEIDMMVVSRMQQGLFNWKAPDESGVLTYSPGGYWYMSYAFQNKNELFRGLTFIPRFAKKIKKSTIGNETEKFSVPFLWDLDMNPPGGTKMILNKWNQLSGHTWDSLSGNKMELPNIKYATSSQIYKLLKIDRQKFPKIAGERPNVWLYIHGPSHEWALHASRDADILLPDAEKFSTINSLLEGNFNHYPADDLKKAWEAKIYPDHGWGGYHGNITDNVFLQKFLYAKEEGKRILNNSLQSIAGKVKYNTALGTPVGVFNSLSWNRDAPVEAVLKFSKDKAHHIKLVNSKGIEIPYQFSEIDYYDDQSLKSAKISFIALDIPSIGYATYYVHPIKSKIKDAEVPRKARLDEVFESDYYRIQLGKGGLKSIFDKTLGKELLNTDKFMGGEIFTMHSEGNGAGDFADIQKPDMQGFDKTSLHSTQWKIVEDGPVFTAIQFRNPIKYAEAQLTVVLYKHLKRIDFKVDILNWEGILYREFRMAMPLNMEQAKVAYQVPFGILRVGEDELHQPAGAHYNTTDCREVHPRSIGAWIGAGNDTESVTLSSDVAAADYIDPTTAPVDYTILQPILFASRKSCHARGNDYLQTGAHHFTFSFTSSSTPDLVAQNRQGIGNHVSLLSVADPVSSSAPFLNERFSFLNTDGRNILITALKKAEDEDKICVRFYNASGEDQDVKLNFFRNATNAMRTNIIEEPLQPLKGKGNSIKLKVGKYSIETFTTDLIK